MIVFKGDLSKDTKKHLADKRRKKYIFMTLLIDIIMCLVIVLMFSFTYKITSLILLEICGCILIFILFQMFIIFKMKVEDDIPFPNSVVIENEKFIYEGVKIYNERNFNEIKQLIDYGNFYIIKCNLAYDKPFKYFLQKNLIVEGTIEEFEKLMEENNILIIRKLKDKNGEKNEK